MSLESSAHPISAVNTAAIAAMQQGNYGNSTNALKRALAALKESLGPDSPTSSAVQGSANTRPCDATPLYSVAPSCEKRVGLMAGSSSNFEVFTNAFHLPDEWCSASSGSESKASVVILYNMGLSYQLSGLSRASSKDLRMARDLYKMALSIVQTCVAEVSTDRLLLIQLLALFNNLGHVHSCCFDEEETNHCLSALQGLFASRAFAVAKYEDSSNVFEFFEWSALSIAPSSHSPFTFAPAA